MCDDRKTGIKGGFHEQGHGVRTQRVAFNKRFNYLPVINPLTITKIHCKLLTQLNNSPYNIKVHIVKYFICT